MHFIKIQKMSIYDREIISQHLYNIPNNILWLVLGAIQLDKEIIQYGNMKLILMHHISLLQRNYTSNYLTSEIIEIYLHFVNIVIHYFSGSYTFCIRVYYPEIEFPHKLRISFSSLQFIMYVSIKLLHIFLVMKIHELWE